MITILVIIVYLTNGNPAPNWFVIDNAKEVCDNETALRYTRNQIAAALPEDVQMQSLETMLWACLPVPAGPGPGPAMRPALLQGQTEAAQLR